MHFMEMKIQYTLLLCEKKISPLKNLTGSYLFSYLLASSVVVRLIARLPLDVAAKAWLLVFQSRLPS